MMMDRPKHVEPIGNKYTNQKGCILLVNNYSYTNDARTHERHYYCKLVVSPVVCKNIWVGKYLHVCKFAA